MRRQVSPQRPSGSRAGAVPRLTKTLAAVLIAHTALAAAHAQSGRAGRKTEAEPVRRGEYFNSERALEHVKSLVGFGPRPAGSKALALSRRYIEKQLRGVGLDVSTDEWTAETPAGKLRMANVIAELRGETEEAIIVASHYDTKRFKDFPFVGANDGASSTAVLIEIARSLAVSREKRHFTYRFVFFDGEESVCADWDECGRPGAPDNTYGSRRYVGRLRARNQLKNVRALVLLDMVGYEKLELGRETASTPWLIDIIWGTARSLGYGDIFLEREEAVGGDDHEPFLAAGVPAVDIIQLETYPHWHTRDDTLDKISRRSLRVVGEVVLASLPRVEEKLKGGGL